MEKSIITPEYQQQLESLARTLTERFSTEVEVVNPLSIPRDEEPLNRWDSLGNYFDAEA